MLALAAGGAATLARAAQAQAPPEPLSPEAVLRTLLAGNQRYVNNDVESLDEDTTILREGTAGRQPVLATVLSCTDLAEPPELIFDQPVGRIRTVKTPGAVVTHAAVAELEYAVSGLGAALVIVLGHSGCAAIAAAIKARPVFGKPGPYADFARAVLQGQGDPVVTAKINALVQVAMLGQASSLLVERVNAGTLLVGSAYFDAGTRRVTGTS